VHAAEPRARSFANAKCTGNIAQSLPRSQLRLGTRRSGSREHVVPHRNAPGSRELRGDERALVVPSLPLTRRRKRNGNERPPLLDNILGPAEARHPLRDRRCHIAPPRILERANDVTTGARRNPAVRAGSAHERREIIAPPATVATTWMAASFTSRVRQLPDKRPAMTAHNSLLASRNEAFANHAANREDQVGKRTGTRAETGRDGPG
jgi:hypothetical protein